MADRTTPADEAEHLALLKKMLGGYLRQTRLGLGQTTDEVARRIDVPNTAIRRAESGDAAISTDLMLRALLACGQRPSDLARVLLDA